MTTAETLLSSYDPVPVASDTEDLWVFGYGSLMWRPGFPFVEAVQAVLVGYQRAFCVYSTHHRGTAERPGLVLGLDQGGTCHGLAYRVCASERQQTLDYLRAREQINGVYREVLVPLQLKRHGVDVAPPAGRGVDVYGVTYVVERAHPSYAGHLTLAEQARIIRSARGQSGPNVDYLVNTAARARSLGLPMRDLARVETLVHPYFRRAARHRTGHPSPEALALIKMLRGRRFCPRQPRLGDRRRFRFRMNREADTDHRR